MTKHLHLITAIAAAAVTLSVSFDTLALPATHFTKESKLATGLWKKINTRSGAGVYEISHDRLRQMGFTNPEDVCIYGRVPSMMPDNFISEYGGILVSDDLTPVVSAHIGGKMYFYAYDVDNVTYRYDTDTPAEAAFTHGATNVYTTEGTFFLAERKADRLEPAAATVAESAPDAMLGYGYDYFFHEVDALHNYNQSGHVFFGEDLLSGDHTLSVPYTLPMADTGAPAYVTCVAAQQSGTAGSTITFGFSGGDASSQATASFAATDLKNRATYSLNSPTGASLTLPAQSGSVTVTYTPKGSPSAANLDYLMVGYRKALGLTADMAQSRAWLPEYTASSHGGVLLSGAPDGTEAWLVSSPSKVTRLQTLRDADGNLVARGLKSKLTTGDMLVIFDPSRPQLAVSDAVTVPNQNLHSMATPNMVIITLPEFEARARQLAALHRSFDGTDVAVVTGDAVVNEFSAGVPDPMAYRTFLKMLYDHDSTRIKNVLLFGPQMADNRQLTRQAGMSTLLAYQTPESNVYDATFLANDILGTMHDYYTDAVSGSKVYGREIDLGVGVLPVMSDGECSNIIDKIAAYMADDSFPYWLDTNLYLADIDSGNDHVNFCEEIANATSRYHGNDLVSNKVYMDETPEGRSFDYMRNGLINGSVMTTYFGHGNSYSFGSGVCYMHIQDLRRLSNSRLSFMNFAGCDITHFDRLNRGLAVSMVLMPRYGLVGGMMSNRTAWSTKNKDLMALFIKATYCRLNGGAPVNSPLDKPRTLGECYALSKTMSTEPNEMVYHLIADPGITLPIPSASMTVKALTDIKNLTAGSTFTIEGQIVDRDKEPIDSFNGTVVAKVHTPAYTSDLEHVQGPSTSAYKVTRDCTVMGIQEAKVTDGKFTMDILVPDGLTPGADVYNTVRFSAYDPTAHTAALYRVALHTVEAPAEGTPLSADTQSPVVTQLYANHADVPDGALLPESPVIYATVTDNLGLRTIHTGMGQGLQFAIDDKVMTYDLIEYMRAEDAGKTIKLTVPLTGLSNGQHNVTLTAADLAGNIASRTLTFTVGVPEAIELRADDTIVRTEAVLTAPGVGAATLIVTDAAGATVYSAATRTSRVTWPLTDNKGQRVSRGVYTAYLQTLDGRHTAPCRLTVLNP